MIWYVVLNALVSGINTLFAWLPHVTELPYGIDTALTTTFGYWYAFLAVMWPLEIVWTMVLFYYGIKVGLFFLRMVPFAGRAVV